MSINIYNLKQVFFLHNCSTEKRSVGCVTPKIDNLILSIWRLNIIGPRFNCVIILLLNYSFRVRHALNRIYSTKSSQRKFFWCSQKIDSKEYYIRPSIGVFSCLTTRPSSDGYLDIVVRQGSAMNSTPSNFSDSRHTTKTEIPAGSTRTESRCLRFRLVMLVCTN